MYKLYSLSKLDLKKVCWANNSKEQVTNATLKGGFLSQIKAKSFKSGEKNNILSILQQIRKNIFWGRKILLQLLRLVVNDRKCLHILCLF